MISAINCDANDRRPRKTHLNPQCSRDVDVAVVVDIAVVLLLLLVVVVAAISEQTGSIFVI